MPNPPDVVEGFGADHPIQSSRRTLPKAAGEPLPPFNSDTDISIFIEQPVGRPRQGVLQGITRVDRQRATRIFTLVDGFEMADEVIRDDADKTGSQPALGRNA